MHTYISPTAKITEKFNVLHNQYADDTQLYVALSKTLLTDAVSNLQNCLAAVHMWFSENGLVINPEKSEAVLLCTAWLAQLVNALTQVHVQSCL